MGGFFSFEDHPLFDPEPKPSKSYRMKPIKKSEVEKNPNEDTQTEVLPND